MEEGVVTVRVIPMSRQEVATTKKLEILMLKKRPIPMRNSLLRRQVGTEGGSNKVATARHRLCMEVVTVMFSDT